MGFSPATTAEGEVGASPLAAPSPNALRWLLGLRLVVVSTLFVGVLVIQLNTQLILQLKYFYGLILLSYGLSLGYLILHIRGFSTRFQAIVQLLGDIALVTGFVYFTGGLYSPFSFLYLTVIVVAAVLLRGGGLIFAGLSAIAYGVLVDLMVFGVLSIPPNLAGFEVPLSASRVLSQIMIHVVGFALVALLVSYLGESLRTAHSRLEEESERATQFVALTDHVVRSVGAGIVAADLDGKVLHLNPAGTRILGVADEDSIIGQPLREVMPLDDQDWNQLKTRARSRPVERLTASLRATETRLGLSVGPLRDEQGSTVGFIVNFQDLTELVIETERRRMQERMAAVGEMASRMAHEIKNPLASISGSAQVLAKIGGIDETGSRLLRIVVDESRRLSGILDGFLDYARPKQATHQPCDLSEILRDCLDLLRRSDEIRDHHHLDLEVPGELVVQGDDHLLRQLFWNLSRNALQAMPDGGELRITAAQIENAVVLTWLDSGVGMDPEIRRRAFEPFVTSQPEGTGLGLAVVYAAVEDHGGSIDIDSTPGKGTKVTVELPKRLEAA
jgi:two-component system sensor histidine kinase PilS (NtrC family)